MLSTKWTPTIKEQGVLITDGEENSRLKGYRTLYREDQALWPELTGMNVRTTLKHQDLELTLRKEGVAQCILLDGGDQLIGPYDRYHKLYQEYINCHTVLTHCHPREVGDPVNPAASRWIPAQGRDDKTGVNDSLKTLIQNEKTLKPELMKNHDIHTTNQILYHFEKTGSMPSEKELSQITSRVENALDHFSPHQPDKIFTHALPQEDQKQVQFERQNQMER